MFWASSIAAGICLCLCIYLLLRPGMAPSSLPTGSSFSLMVRLIWPWVDKLAMVISPFLSWKFRLKIEKELCFSGLGQKFSYRHIAAFQLLSCLVVCFLLLLLTVVFLGLSFDLAVLISLLAGLLCSWLPRHQIHLQANKRQRLILKAFPFMLDMTTLCVESGLNLQGALIQAARLSPEGPLRQELRHALNDMRAGMPRLDALRNMSDRTGVQELKQWVSAMAQADSLGMGLGPMLRAQSDQRRSERFLRAEKLAIEAPVKMLFPLVLCIFPCTFIVLAFPIGMKLLNSGLA